MENRNIYLIIILLFVALLTGCGGSNESTDGAKEIQNENKSEASSENERNSITLSDEKTAWEGVWTIEVDEQEDGQQLEHLSGVTFTIDNSKDGKFDFIYAKDDQPLVEGTASQTGYYTYYNDVDDCYVSFKKVGRQMKISTHDSSGSLCAQLQLPGDSHNEYVFSRTESHLSNFQQLLFLMPKQDELLRGLLKSSYDYLVDHFQEFEEIENLDPFYALAFENNVESPHTDGSAVILYNEFNQLWISFVRDGTLVYYTNDEDYAEKLPETIQNKFGDLPVVYVNKNNAKKYADKTLADFPILNEDLTHSFIKRGKGETQIRAYYNLGIGSFYKHGEFDLLLNKRYQKLTTKVTLEKGSKGMNIYFVGDDYEGEYIDRDINFTGQILQAVELTPSERTKTISVPVSGVQKLKIITSAQYEEEKSSVIFSKVDLQRLEEDKDFRKAIAIVKGQYPEHEAQYIYYYFPTISMNGEHSFRVYEVVGDNQWIELSQFTVHTETGEIEERPEGYWELEHGIEIH